jgi:hypothetical protein
MDFKEVRMLPQEESAVEVRHRLQGEQGKAEAILLGSTQAYGSLVAMERLLFLMEAMGVGGDLVEEAGLEEVPLVVTVQMQGVEEEAATSVDCRLRFKLEMDPILLPQMVQAMLGVNPVLSGPLLLVVRVKVDISESHGISRRWLC